MEGSKVVMGSLKLTVRAIMKCRHDRIRVVAMSARRHVKGGGLEEVQWRHQDRSLVGRQIRASLEADGRAVVERSACSACGEARKSRQRPSRHTGWKVEVKAGEVGCECKSKGGRRVDVVQLVSVYLPRHLMICGDTPGKAARGLMG